ncbi:uroporphyrinogen-III synthase [Bacillus sp. B15-48]|uniref:uroporphyrinogen-III synthase n=1 Tax=Bacillus sp. B15-48 TaxID=1548601 RepID=UPI00193FC602|nr:uroporphyrinogen-III synthase [Bacillus sp. B15-48]MBM4762461.1 uroporphyrinogen-III synthase [Bacillus sp. B15-48]
MTSAPPLQNKRVMIPRGEKHAQPFSELVKRLGGIPVEIPLIAFRPTAVSEQLATTLNEIHTYDWIVFTSNVTVETFFDLYQSVGYRFPKVAAIGEKTRQTLLERNIKTDFMPNEYVAEGFVHEFLPYVSAGMRVFIPKGNLARAYIATSLKKRGAFVKEQVIYETYFPEESKEKLERLLNDEQVDVLAFTSPSTIDHFMEIVKKHHFEAKISSCVVACIGPVAKKKAEEYGLTVHVCPNTYTVEEMMNSVVNYLIKRED